ncbi:MAG: oligosaccharide flippase family protein [Myxococcota bacterium]
MSSSAGTTSIRSRALRGTLWVLMGNGAAQGLRLVSNLVLSRLLFPEAFGLMAIVNLVTYGLQMISNVGIRPAIIRHADGDQRDFLDTAWTLQIVRGAVLAVIALLLAWPLARFYDEPMLAGLVAVAALVPLIDGFASTRLASLTRQIDLRGPVVVSVLAKLGSIAAMIAFALWYRSVWALVVGTVVSTLLNVLLSHWLLPGEHDRLRFDRRHAREILTFGQWILVSTLFTFLAQRIDVMLISRLVSMDVLGVYSIGLVLTHIPQRIFGQFSQRVLMPALSESHRSDAARLEGSLREAKRILLPFGGLALLGALAVAPAFFHFLYDPRYADAGWIAQLALVALWFALIHDANGRALLALGDSKRWALSNAVRTFVAAAGCLAGFHWAGLPGVLVGLSAGGVAGFAVVASALARAGVRVGRVDLTASAAFLAVGALCGGVPYLVTDGASRDGIALITLGLGVLLLTPPALWQAAKHRALWSR